jgi:hypothetical protein
MSLYTMPECPMCKKDLLIFKSRAIILPKECEDDLARVVDIKCTNSKCEYKVEDVFGIEEEILELDEE